MRRLSIIDLATCVSRWLVRQFDERFAARHAKVALSGDGGDEMFAGYESFSLAQQLVKWE